MRSSDPAESVEELFEEAPCGFISTAADGTLLRVNRTFERWTGHDRDTLIGSRRLQDLLTPGARIYHETHYRPLLEMQGTVREIAVEIVCADGSRLPVLINSILHREAGVARTTIFDASDRRRYENELLAARRRAEQSSEHHQDVAHVLQQSMLAGDLPADARYELVPYYSPAVATLEVGGDWYDAFLVDPDRLALVIGDVVGRGLGAAATMGQLRSAVRALAATGCGPARLLDHLDAYVEMSEPARSATVVYAELDLRSHRLRYACAGHPPPAVTREGEEPALLWGGRSAPLGAIIEAQPRPEAQAVLSPGDRVLFYTDGLVERRDRPIDLGFEQLLATMRDERDAPLEQLVAVLADVLGATAGGDDVCMLAAVVSAASAGT